MSIDKSTQPVALAESEGEALWFIGTLVTIKADGRQTRGQSAVIEHLAPKGAGSPLHVHTREDEWFYVMDGELAFWVGGARIQAKAGAFVYGPRGIPHTFVVVSEQARFLLGVTPAGFEDFVRAASVPAQMRTLPPAGSAPAIEPSRLAGLAAQYGIEVLGPPGIPE
jgi:quercetin dioxygenase-like cupin family protein